MSCTTIESADIACDKFSIFSNPMFEGCMKNAGEDEWTHQFPASTIQPKLLSTVHASFSNLKNVQPQQQLLFKVKPQLFKPQMITGDSGCPGDKRRQSDSTAQLTTLVVAKKRLSLVVQLKDHRASKNGRVRQDSRHLNRGGNQPSAWFQSTAGINGQDRSTINDSRTAFEQKRTVDFNFTKKYCECCPSLAQTPPPKSILKKLAFLPKDIETFPSIQDNKKFDISRSGSTKKVKFSKYAEVAVFSRE